MQTDPHELTNLANQPAHQTCMADFRRRLAAICDPDAADAAAKADQTSCIQANGGTDAVLAAGQQINFTRAPEQFPPQLTPVVRRGPSTRRPIPSTRQRSVG